MFVFVVLLLLNASYDWQNQPIRQSDRYIEVLTRTTDKASVNYWALTEVFFSNCQVQDYILTQISNSDVHKYYAGIQTCEDNENPSTEEKLDVILDIALTEGYTDLFAYYLTQKNQQHPVEAFQKYLHHWGASLSLEERTLLQQLANKEILNEKALPLDANFLIHLGVLTSPFRSDLYAADDLKHATSEWLTHIKSNESPKGLEYSVLLMNIITAAYLTDDEQIIIDHYQDFLNSSEFPHSSLKISRLNAIEYILYSSGRYDQGLEMLREDLIPLATHLKNHELVDRLLATQGTYLFQLGKYKESKNIYESLYQNKNISHSQTRLFNNLGISYLKLGHKNKYISFQMRALENAIDENDYKALLNIYRNLFVVNTSTTDISSALVYIDRAKELATVNKDSTELALIDSYLGSFYWRTFKDHTEALKYFNSAEKILSTEKGNKRYLNLLLEKALILSKIDSLDNSKKLYHQISEISLSQSNTPVYLESLIGRTAIELTTGNLPGAEELFNNIKIYPLDDLTFELLVKYYNVKAEYLYKIGEVREAIKQLKPIITQVIERVKSSTDSQAGYWTVEDEYLDAFSLMVKMLTESGYYGEALVLLDQLKTINDASLYNNPLVKASKLSEQDLAEEKRLNTSLQALRKQYLNAGEDKRFALKTEIDRTSAAREEILSTVNSHRDKPLSPIWAIQRTIQDDELLLHFTEIGSQLYVTRLTSSSINIQNYPLNKNDQEFFTSVANNLASGKTDLNELYSVYENLDLDELPPGTKRITVIPDNYLYRIPLEVLPTKKPFSSISYGSANYLIEDYHFRYFTSLQEYENNKRSTRSATTEDFSVFAISEFKDVSTLNLPSLPFATFEATSVSSALPSFPDKNIYTGSSATKQEFKNKVSSSRMIHVATHSEVSEQDPLFSTIYLKGDVDSDTLESDQALYAYELFDTTLESEFIMLNSCSSGSGNYMQGTGIMGISRALRYAGAKSLALNLWSVNDKVASIFATDFYTYINDGETKNEATRQAKLNQLRSANANPHFWGAYMMIGNPSPMISKPAKPYLLYSLLATTILLAGYMVRKNEVL
ncbi:MAG: CHAT domain-containing protein [Balneolaceae bacterium]